MADVRIIDETDEKDSTMTVEELKEKIRQEYIKKLVSKKQIPAMPSLLIIIKAIMIISLVIMILSMATSSGVLLAASMIVLIISSAVSYLFYDGK